jgi:hypothetical protein
MSEMDAEELAEWMVYDQLYHLPDSYWQAGMIAHTMACCMSKGKHKITDFMPSQPIRHQSSEEIKRHMDSLLGIHF